MVDLLDRLDALLGQELLSYRTEDYLAPGYQQRLQLETADDENISLASFSVSSCSTSSSGINEVWREKKCEWSYQVVDHFDFSREIVSISIHYLDRYLATRVVNKKLFQLAAMTTLYLAIKLYEPGTVSMKSMIELSRGYFLVDQMAAMEMAILRALSWKMHPPTAYSFTKHILFLLPYTSVNMDTRYDILELTRFLTELSVIDYYFVMHRQSVVAIAALLNSMEAIPSVSESAIADLKMELQRLPGLYPDRPEVEECRQRLRLLYQQGGYVRPETTGTRNETVSPVCVSYGLTNQDIQSSSQGNSQNEKGPVVFHFSEVSVNDVRLEFDEVARKGYF